MQKGRGKKGDGFAKKDTVCAKLQCVACLNHPRGKKEEGKGDILFRQELRPFKCERYLCECCHRFSQFNVLERTVERLLTINTKKCRHSLPSQSRADTANLSYLDIVEH